ncbi:MAG: glycine--tRNA ligase subunit beta, partial [Pseudomonadota bacterium]
HYSPLGPSDDVPNAPVSVAVALADKLDTLTGFWAIDEKPTGSKDPFALRRAALGVIRLVLESDLRMRITDYTSSGFVLHYRDARSKAKSDQLRRLAEGASNLGIRFSEAFRVSAQEVTRRARKSGELPSDEAALKEQHADEVEIWTADLSADLLSFFHDRLKVYLRDQGIRHDIIDACIAMPQNDDLTLLVKRARALSETLATDDGENLIQGFKRANNILSQAEEADGVEYSYGADIKFAEEPEEKALFQALDTAEAKIAPTMEAQDFKTAMQAMATLRTPIDAFFEAVQINADNQTVRRNRLNLLSRIRTLCLSVADLTKIEG